MPTEKEMLRVLKNYCNVQMRSDADGNLECIISAAKWNYVGYSATWTLPTPGSVTAIGDAFYTLEKIIWARVRGS